MSDAVSRAISGTISSFDPVQGFGVITTNDGRELRFDVGVCRFGDPRVGENVRFEMGPSRLGGERVAWVERQQNQRVARASVAPPATPTISNDALLALLSTSDGATRDLLEELVRRRATQFRTAQTLGKIIERLERCKKVDDYKEVTAALQDLYASIGAD
jgi:cold shock CspA family protein